MDKSLRMEKTNEDIEKEQELVLLFKQGNQQAFNEIVSLYQRRIYKLAYGFFQDGDDAMEIVQETFIRVYEKIDKFDGNTPFKSWIYRVAHNICIDYYRKFKKKKIESSELYEVSMSHQSIPKKPEDQVEAQNFTESVRDSIQHLSKKQKVVFVMKHYNGLKYHEISSSLNISVGTVKSLYHRAVQSLKKNILSSEAV
jgi:RNA polymerase sigma-70 factor (ECF subfamily)